MSLRTAIFLALFLVFSSLNLEARTGKTYSGSTKASSSTRAKKYNKKKIRTKSKRKKTTKTKSAKVRSKKQKSTKSSKHLRASGYIPKTQREDPSIRLLTLCGDSTGCLLAECIVFAPIFPWFLYPFDTPATKYETRRFNDFSGVLDFGLMKANNRYSGYKAAIGSYIKWVGLELAYDTYNNGEFDQNFYSAYFVIRPFPRRHMQPKLLIGWKHIKTDKVSGGGLSISFFNYDIAFNRRLWMNIINYISWVKGYTLVEGSLGFEYYVYPTISIKTSMDIRHIATEYLYGVNVGLSIKI